MGRIGKDNDWLLAQIESALETIVQLDRGRREYIDDRDVTPLGEFRDVAVLLELVHRDPSFPIQTGHRNTCRAGRHCTVSPHWTTDCLTLSPEYVASILMSDTSSATLVQLFSSRVYPRICFAARLASR